MQVHNFASRCRRPWSQQNLNNITLYITTILYKNEISFLFIVPDVDNFLPNTVEPGYIDIGLYNISYIASDILWHKLIPYS